MRLWKRGTAPGGGTSSSSPVRVLFIPRQHQGNFREPEIGREHGRCVGNFFFCFVVGHSLKWILNDLIWGIFERIRGVVAFVINLSKLGIPEVVFLGESSLNNS